MTRIQSSVGLVTGIPIEETVNKLMQVAARPKEMLANRTKLLESEKLAITQMTSLLVAFQFETRKLASESLFQSKEVASSNAAALSAKLASGGNPAVGNYLFTPIRTASAQQFLSQSFTPEALVGEGSFSFRTGGFVDRSASLEDLNGGAGVQRGKIRLTDRRGDSTIIDLSYAKSIDDVLRAISDSTDINVTAEAAGDAIRLVDNSGGTGNLIVQNVGGGTTATDLGFADINVAASEAIGGDIHFLSAQTRLAKLNDGLGVHLRRGGVDLDISFADGSTLAVDLGDAQTVGDVLQAINAVAPEKLSAAISADGNRLEITDLTSGSGTFEIASAEGISAAENLRIAATAAGGIIAGGRVLGGLKDSLLATLDGGNGLGSLGTIEFTNRNGVSSSVNLAGMETLAEVLDAINSQAVGIRAEINSQHSGILIRDTTGATAGNLVIADGDATATATKLGIAGDVSAAQRNGGSLRKQSVSGGTLLSSLGGGVGIDVGAFKITDSAGNIGAVDLDQVDNTAVTLGDVIDRINALSNVAVEARLNDNGDGIVLVDTAGGTGKLTVTEVGKGTTARDLRILGEASEVEIDGTPTQVIDGTTAVTIDIDNDDTLVDIVEKVNAAGGGVTASILNDGTGQRLSLTVDTPGEANAVIFDGTGSALSFLEVSRARDALLLYGSVDAPGSSILISSQTNDFKNVIEGVELTVNAPILEPVAISVTTSSSAIVETVSEFVDAYNSIRDQLAEHTKFDAESNTTGILFGTREALRVESDLAYLMTSRIGGVGELSSLEAVGISLDDKGKMSLDADKLTGIFNEDPDALKRLFADEEFGVAARLDEVLERLIGVDNSLLATRANTLTRNIASNAERIESMDERLAAQRDRLTLQFYQLETMMAEFQRGISALSSLQPIPPLTSTRS